MLARLAAACWRNKWLQAKSSELSSHIHDQGLTVFVLRQEAVRRGFQEQIIEMIRNHGFDILATRMLSEKDVQYAAARTRGGNWGGGGPFDLPGGPPAVAVVAYDPNPLPMTRKQRRKFAQRTNARIFIKETIRDAIVAQLPPNQGFNALHSSDHAAEAWHLIEVLAPQLIVDVRDRLNDIHQTAARKPALRRAA
jgi:nucleoside diphosphate kinase